MTGNACVLTIKNIKHKKCQIKSIYVKVPTDDCFVGLVLGISVLLHRYSESRTRS